MLDYRSRLSPGRRWAWLRLPAQTQVSEGPGPFSRRGVKGRELATCQQTQDAVNGKLRGTDPGCHPSQLGWELPRNSAPEILEFPPPFSPAHWCNKLPQTSPTSSGQTGGTRVSSTAGAYVPFPSDRSDAHTSELQSRQYLV